MVTSKSLFRSLMLLGLTTVIPLLIEQRQASASNATNIQATAPTEVFPKVKFPGVEIPELPPLEERERISPPEEESPAETTQVTRLVIKLSERRVYAYRGDLPLTSYPIAVGKDGWETPLGAFQVLQMLRDPAWEHPWTGEVVPPGPNNPLGDRWIGFWTDGKNYIGFHGTTAEELVGQAVSHGCIRMLNKDVRALFEKVAIGTPVIVQP